MKAPLKPRRPSPAEAVAIAAKAAPQQSPAQAPAADDAAAALNLRLRTSTINSLAAVAAERGITMKQVIAMALQEAGVAVAGPDLEDRTPRRK